MTSLDSYRRLFGKKQQHDPFVPHLLEPPVRPELGPKPAWEDTDSKDYKIKVVLAGSKGVGKRTLIDSWGFEGYSGDYLSKLGVNFFRKTMTVMGDKKAMVSTWYVSLKSDLLLPEYFKGASAAMLMFDVADRKSFDSLLTYSIPTPGMRVVVGNKCDRPRQVEGSEAVAYAERIDAAGYVEVSATDRLNTAPLLDFVSHLSFYDLFPTEQRAFRYVFTDLVDKMGPSCYLNPKLDWRKST